MDDRRYTEAQVAILNLWESWPQKGAGAYADMQSFYLWLEKHHASLLDFPVPHGTDRWQEVRAWLNRRTHYGEQA